MRTPSINASLEKTISRERLSKYLSETEGDLDKALSLYERNTRLSEALYTPLQSLEVCLRNTVHFHMAQMYGIDWLMNGQAPLTSASKNFASEAYDEACRGKSNPDIGSIVAELKFSFWVGLLGPKYDATLWRRALYKGFLSGGGKPSSLVHGRFNAIRRFRNRVAHHEPIFIPASKMHGEIIEAIGWMCMDTQAWTIHQSRFDAVSDVAAG